MAKKLLIVEEALRDLKAHWFEYIKTIAKAAEDLGWEVSVAFHKDAAPEIKDTFDGFPVFQHARYLDQGGKKLPGERHYSFILHSIRSLKVLWPLLYKQPRYDAVFVPTVLVHHLLAWYIIMKSHPNKPQKTTLFFVTNPGIWDAEKKKSFFPKSAVFLKYLLKLFKPLVQAGSVVMAVETEGAKKEFEELTGLPFLLLPHPVPVNNESTKNDSPANNSKANKGISFGCYGFARHEKGSDLLKAAVEEILASNPNFEGHFTIQWTDAFSMPDGTKCGPGKTLTNHSKVRIIDRAVGSAEYRQLLSQTDCMILPYRNSSYHARVSRVAIEAATSSIPVIYTKHGWLEETIERFGAGIGIEDESITELKKAIINLQENFMCYQKDAAQQQPNAKRYYSPENFCNLLLA